MTAFEIIFLCTVWSIMAMIAYKNTHGKGFSIIALIAAFIFAPIGFGAALGDVLIKYINKR